MTPTGAEGWIAAANARLADARAMLPARCNSVGSVYLAGYAVECILKAYLQRIGKGFPRYGSEGHNLKALWQASGFRLREIGDIAGERTFYLDSWDTALRYESEVLLSLQVSELVDGASGLVSFIQTHARRGYRRGSV